MSQPDTGIATGMSRPSNHYLISADESLAGQPRARWALGQLSASLSRSGTEAVLRWSGSGSGSGSGSDSAGARAGARLVVTTAGTALGRRLLAESGITVPDRPESFAIFPAGPAAPGATVVCAADAAGAGYAALDLVDLVESSPGAGSEAISGRSRPVVAAPLNRMRGVARSFVSERDKDWFYDRDFWTGYLTSLAASRFNRFHLALSIGYDSFYHADVTDTYFLFPYPFLVDVPGFDVTVDNLPAAERERNLRTLNLIAELCAERGLHFQLGLWTHGIEWADQDNLSHPVRGLSAKNHASYCRAALAQLLTACPGIDGVTLRVHGESGISEAADDFWREIFGAVTDCGRLPQLDLHSKGLSQPVLDAAVATGAEVVVSPKFAAEHMSLPYHLTDIRPWEQRPSKSPRYPRAGLAAWDEKQIMLFSAGSRNFTRYSYGDFLRVDRDYDVLYRVWPGTQRLLQWGDPAFASALAQSGTFCGSGGVEICEPLFFLGRRGSLATPVSGGPWPGIQRSRRYEHTYRTFGHALFGPESSVPPATGTEGGRLESALAHASRILPLVTSAHCPSAANNHYWPEMYANVPIVAGAHPSSYSDTPLPGTFGAVSPLDPAMFASPDSFVAEVLADVSSGRYSPIQVASWLERLAGDAMRELAGLSQAPVPDGEPDTGADISMLAGLGLFFARKMRAAVLYGLSRQLSSRSLASEALAACQGALDAWEELAATGTRLYGPEAVFGPEPWLRGLWADRTAAIAQDVAALAAEVAGYGDAPDMAAGQDWAAHLEARALPPAPATAVSVRESVRPDGSVAVAVVPTTAPPFGPVSGIVMKYREVDQSQRYSTVQLTRSDGHYTAVIPARGEFPEFCLQYYLVLETAAGSKWIYPGIGPGLCGQPYRVIDPYPRSEKED